MSVVSRRSPEGDGGWINAGFFVVEPEVFDLIEGDATVFEREPLENLARKAQLVAYVHRGFWQPMDTLRDKTQLEALWRSGKARGRSGNDDGGDRPRVLAREAGIPHGTHRIQGVLAFPLADENGRGGLRLRTGPSDHPNLYELARINSLVKSTIADVRDAVTLARALAEARPEWSSTWRPSLSWGNPIGFQRRPSR